jgi:predicted RecB family nuclease
MDTELKGFDQDLLLENYTKKNKKIFCQKIFDNIGPDAVKIADDSFVMKTSKVPLYFKNYEAIGIETGSRKYSLFTIEYSTIKVLKNGDISKTHKFYNFKNWLHSTECRYRLDNKFILGRKYSTYDGYDWLARNPYEYEDLHRTASIYMESIRNRTIGVDIFPNMKNTSDFPFHNAKKLISERYEEITSLRGVSVKERDQYIDKGITKRSQLDLERSDANFVNFNKLPLIDRGTEIVFMDFEILTSVYDDFSLFPASNTKNHLFNVGCCRVSGEVVSFVSRSLREEKDMVVAFVNYLNNLQCDSITFVHWTDIEKRIFREKIKEYSDHVLLEKEIFWFDLHDYFVKSDIYIKDCPNYKLKTVSRCLEKYGYIKSKWDNGLFFDGLGAMTGFIKYLDNKDESILEEIVKYNVVDCKVMLEIYEFLSEM